MGPRRLSKNVGSGGSFPVLCEDGDCEDSRVCGGRIDQAWQCNSEGFSYGSAGSRIVPVQQGGKRVVLALDEIKDWNPGSELLEPDVLVLETGWFEQDKQGEQIIPTDHWIRKSEASFEETLELVQKVYPRLAIATHIEELNGRSYVDYLELEKRFKKYKLRFAYDGFRVSL